MRRLAAHLRPAAAGILIAAALVAPASPAPAASGVENYCNPDYPATQSYGALPQVPDVISGTITGGDGGPWQVAVQSDDGFRTSPQTTAPDGSFSIPVDSSALANTLGGGRLVIDGRWETFALPSRTITLPTSTSITVTALHPDTGALLPGARVLAYDLGIFESAGGPRYLGRDDGAALIQGTTDGSGEVTLTDIPVESERVTLIACLDGQIDVISADVSQGARAFTMPSDADGVIGVFEDGADGDGDGNPDGDGNQDGLRDSLQSNVATLPVDPDVGPLLTVAAPAGTVLRGVITSSPPIDPPPGATLPFGLIGFRLTGITPGSTHNVTVHLPSVDGVVGYLKYLSDTQSWGVMPSDRVAIDPAADTVVLTLTDGGIGDRDGTVNGVIDDPGGPYTGPGAGADTNPADGIPDSLQPDGTPEFAFRDTSTTPATYGRLVNSNGLIGRITDAADPTKGVLVTVDPRVDGTGSGPAELEACGSTVLVEPGSQVVLTCASIILSPITGSATVVLDNGDTVTVPAGSSAEIEDTPDGVTLTNVTGGGVTASISGQTITVPDGAGPVAYPLPDTGGSLRGAEGYSSGSFEKEPASFCSADGSGEIHYTATNPLSGDYGGTMTTEAVVTLGSGTSGGRSPISGLSGTFTITGGSQTISGTLALAPARQATPGGTADFMNEAYCSDAYFQVTARFDATGVQGFSEQGFVKLSGANARYLSPPNLATAEFWVAPVISIQPGGEVDEAGVRGSRYSPPEDVGGYPFGIRVFPAPIDDLEVRMRTTEGSAAAGSDYVEVDTVVPINGIADPEYSDTRSVVVELNDDSVAEPIEEFGATIELASGDAFDGSQMSATAQILDNDSNTASIANLSIAEGNPGAYPDLTLMITSPQPVAAPVYACLVPSGGTATPNDGTPDTDFYYANLDFGGCRTATGDNGALATLNVGEVESSVNVGFVAGDDVVEPDETVAWTIDWIWGAPLPADPTVTLTILNDDVDPDMDSDGIDDVVDADGGDGSLPGQYRYPNPDDPANPFAYGTITELPVDMTLLITKGDPNPDENVRVVASGPGTAKVQNCGDVTYEFTDGLSQELWCGSSISKVLTGGPAVARLDADTFVSIPDGARVEIDTAASGAYTIDVLEAPTSGGEVVTLTNGSATREIRIDEGTVTAQTWTFTGFSQPVDNGAVVNTIKGGRAVPLKWRITQDGVPVTTLTTAKVSFKEVCKTGGTTDAIEQTAADGSGLQNLGNGYYQLNWKTPRDAGTCGTMFLDIGDGVLHSAAFQLK